MSLSPLFLRIIRYCLIATGIVLIGVSLIFSYVGLYGERAGVYTSLEKIPPRTVGIVLGASIYGSTPSNILQDRLQTAVELYRSGKISHFLLSGDNRTLEYNEPEAMRRFLISRSIPETAITLDFAGLDTYDTMYRARDIFAVSDAIIFTQAFHLPRSLYIARRLGIDAVGMASDRREYADIYRLEFREIFARVKAFLDVEILKSSPRFLGTPEPITPPSV